MEQNAAIVLAAGRGSRMNSTVQKQYMLLKGKPLLYYALKQFEAFEGIQKIILVTGEQDIAYCRKEIVDAYGFQKVSSIVAGGKERYDSVYQGLLAAGDCDFVFIHDGARPFPDTGILERTLADVREYRACTAAMPVKDTIKLSDPQQFAAETLERSRLWMIQTPQVFSGTLIKEAYECMYRSGETKGITDDAMVVERFMKHPVKLTEGSYRNIKITTPEDLLIAEAFLSEKNCSKVSCQEQIKPA